MDDNYTTPEVTGEVTGKRKWVGLTDYEFEEILEAHNEAFRFAVYESIEAKLKEKNVPQP